MDAPRTHENTHYYQACDTCGFPLEICECGPECCEICDQPFDRCDCDNAAGVDEDYGDDAQPEDVWGPQNYTAKSYPKPAQTAPPQQQAHAQKPQPPRTTQGSGMMPDYEELESPNIEPIVAPKPKQQQSQAQKTQPPPQAQQPPTQQKPVPGNTFQIQLELSMLRRIVDEKKELLKNPEEGTAPRLKQDVEVLERIIVERLALLNAAESN